MNITGSNDEDIRAIADGKSDYRIGKQEFLNQVFGEVGTFFKDYHCALKGKITLHGRIYSTDRCFIFYSKIFGREKKILIPFSQVTTITQTCTVFRCITIEAGAKTYVFNSFWEAEKSLYYLNEAFEKYRTESNKVTSKDASAVDIEDAEIDEPEMPMTTAEDVALLQTFHKKVKVIKDAILPISFSDFLATFIEDEAPHSYSKYHELVNDRDLDLSPWAECGANEFQREMKFMKPVNLPGLASTRGVKYQQLRRPTDSLFVVASSTRLEDVPSADCFSVDDVLMVHADGAQQVSINISFEVAFVKSTMMRTFIEGPTEREMKKWLETFFQHLQDIVVVKKDIVRGRKTSIIGNTATESSSVPVTSSLPESDTSIPNISNEKLLATPAILPVSVKTAEQDNETSSTVSDQSRTSSSASLTPANPSPPASSAPATDSIATNKVNETKQEFLVNIFGSEVGTLFKDYHCALGSHFLIQGRIYATDKSIAFYSALFGREKAVMIPLNQIKQIAPPHGVLRSIVIDTENKAYTFRSFWEPEKSFQSLQLVWEKAKVANKNIDSTGTTREKRRYSLAADNTVGDDVADPIQDADWLQPNMTEAQAFESYAKKYSLSEKIDTGEPLPMSLAQFTKLFIQEGAPCSYEQFYQDMNQSVPTTTPWTEVKTLEYQREIRFLTPASILALGKSRGVKSQLRMPLGDNGLLLKSSTILEDFSFSAFFTIEEVMLVHNTFASDGNSVKPNSVTVHLSYEIQFAKGCYVAPLLATVGIPELQKWLTSYSKYLHDKAEEYRLSKKTSPQTQSLTAEQNNVAGNMKGKEKEDNLTEKNSKARKIIPNFSSLLSSTTAAASPSSASKATPLVTSPRSTVIASLLAPEVDTSNSKQKAKQSLASNAISPNNKVDSAHKHKDAPQPWTYFLLSVLLLIIVLCVFVWTRQQMDTLQGKLDRIEALLSKLIAQQQAEMK